MQNILKSLCAIKENLNVFCYSKATIVIIPAAVFVLAYVFLPSVDLGNEGSNILQFVELQ